MKKQIYCLVLIGMVLSCGTIQKPISSKRASTKHFPNLNVTPVDPPAGSRFGILNACSQNIWVQNQNTSGLPTLVFIKAGTQYNFSTPGDVPSFKAWAKFSCNSSGQNCVIGQQLAPCPAQGCQPAIDTGIELTIAGAQIDYDVSLVNGFTNPVSVTVFNPSGESTCKNIDASTLSSSICPMSDNLSTPTSQWSPSTPFSEFGNFTTYYGSNGNTNLTSLDLLAVNPSFKLAIGCLSPYFKLVSQPAWGGVGIGICPGNNCPSQGSYSAVDVNNNAFDDRVLMYANAYSGCDLTAVNSTASGSNCAGENRTPLPQSNFVNANAWNNTLNAYCTTGSHGTTSPYCSDSEAAMTVPGTTAATLMARLGPITQTQYVQNIHANVPGVYAWQYDDVNGNYVCNDASTKVVYTIYCVQ